MDIAFTRTKPNDLPASPRRFGQAAAAHARAWHATLPGYAPTPLVRLDGLAAALGLGAVYVKDESKRFGLNAFKSLGGSYALSRCLAELDERPECLTVVTTTDGNHGRGLAWAASLLGCRCVVYLPAGSAPERLAAIRALGAEAQILDMGYDDAVRYAARMAADNGWLLIQDTSWEGYEDIPTWIMQGYTTMGAEALEQLGDTRPTHVFLQAGVGAMSGALTALLADAYGADKPTIANVEPQGADCIYRTAQASDGALHAVPGELDTIMAGLSCGEPCGLGWEMLRDYADLFFAVPDRIAEQGMRLLATPQGGDPMMVSGESGAVTVGLLAALMGDGDLAAARAELGLGPDSVVLLVSTEGDTDPALYRRIVGRQPA